MCPNMLIKYRINIYEPWLKVLTLLQMLILFLQAERKKITEKRAK